MTPTWSDLHSLLNRRSEAVWTKDIEGLMSLYDPAVVYFDVVPGLQYTGAVTLRARFIDWFDAFESPIGIEIRDLNVLAGGDVAVAHMLNRTSGRLKTGREIGHWVRVTVGCRRSDHGWLIAHEHVSLPVDVASGRAAIDLVP